MGLSFKGLGKSLQKAGGNSIVNIATGGLAGTIGELSKGSKANLGAVVANNATRGLSGTSKENGVQGVGKAVKDSGIGQAIELKASDPTAYQAQSDSLLNPIADQFSQFGQNANISSNVDPAFRNYQLGLASQLQAQAMGQGPSVAQMQLQQATDRTLNQSLGQIRAATGANAGLSARTAALAGAQQLGAAGNASGLLRLQEQQQAQQQLAGLSAQGRSGDLTADAQNLQAQKATSDARLQGLQGLANIRQAQVGTANDIYRVKNNVAMQNNQNQNQAKQKVEGAVLSGLSTAAGAFI